MSAKFLPFSQSITWGDPQEQLGGSGKFLGVLGGSSEGPREVLGAVGVVSEGPWDLSKHKLLEMNALQILKFRDVGDFR